MTIPYQVPAWSIYAIAKTPGEVEILANANLKAVRMFGGKISNQKETSVQPVRKQEIILAYASSIEMLPSDDPEKIRALRILERESKLELWEYYANEDNS